MVEVKVRQRTWIQNCDWETTPLKCVDEPASGRAGPPVQDLWLFADCPGERFAISKNRDRTNSWEGCVLPGGTISRRTQVPDRYRESLYDGRLGVLQKQSKDSSRYETCSVDYAKHLRTSNERTPTCSSAPDTRTRYVMHLKWEITLCSAVRPGRRRSSPAIARMQKWQRYDGTLTPRSSPGTPYAAETLLVS